MKQKATEPLALELSLTQIFEALSDPTRLQIVARLSRRPGLCASFGDLGSKTSLSYHFRVLRLAGLTNTEKHGTCRLISLRTQELDHAFPGLLKAVLRNAEKGYAEAAVG